MDVLDLVCLDVESLKKLYQKNVSLLHEKLLSGVDWKETSDLRDFVTELEVHLDKKVRYTDSIYNPDYQVSSSSKFL